MGERCDDIDKKLKKKRKSPPPFTEEHRKNMSIERKKRGVKPPSWKGKKRSAEMRARLSASKKGKKLTFQVWNKGIKTGLKPWLGKKRSKETNNKISLANKGKIRSEEFKKTLSEIIKKQHRAGERKHIYEKLKGINKGEKNGQWQGGKSFEPYSIDWTSTLRASIRERDKYTCQICEEPQRDKAHAVHHIDYDKKNCNPDNLITICHGCHTKTNFKRDKWLNYFKIKYGK